jgi:hypothetical protein
VYTDPQGVRRKVERELRHLVDRIDHFRERGIWVLEYRFPTLLVAFAAARFKPHAIVPFGVLLELSNYDVEPPSVSFVNPFTKVPLKRNELATELQRVRLLPAPALQPGQTPTGPTGPDGQPIRDGVAERFLQFWSDEDIPFMCMRGVREYHNNPGHTGDSWWMHRAQDAGSIIRLLEIIAKYGTEPMVQQSFSFQVQAAGIVVQQVVDTA